MVFEILSHVFKLKMKCSLETIWQICACLVICASPLISEHDEDEDKGGDHDGLSSEDDGDAIDLSPLIAELHDDERWQWGWFIVGG